MEVSISCHEADIGPAMRQCRQCCLVPLAKATCPSMTMQSRVATTRTGESPAALSAIFIDDYYYNDDMVVHASSAFHVSIAPTGAYTGGRNPQPPMTTGEGVLRNADNDNQEGEVMNGGGDCGQGGKDDDRWRHCE
ncbi:hypothetical protein ABZP36_022544 [Zizania latifolia]